MSRVYWDSMVFIYWLEDHPVYAARVREIRRRMLERGDQLCASYLTVGEVMAGALRNPEPENLRRIELFFSSERVEMIPFERDAALRFAKLRAESGVKPADAIHLACAGSSGVDLFLTHDRALHKLQVPGIQFIAGLEASVF